MSRLPDPAVRRRWEDRLRSFEQSGLSVVEFCERNGVSTASFYLWRRKIRDASTSSHNSSDHAGAFVPVTVESAARECFRVRLADRAVVEIPASESATLLRVVERLAADCDGESQP